MLIFLELEVYFFFYFVVAYDSSGIYELMTTEYDTRLVLKWREGCSKEARQKNYYIMYFYDYVRLLLS